jgi:hypothetical protein
MIEFSVYGPFQLKRKSNGCIDASKQSKRDFWERVNDVRTSLADCTGCYVFVLKAGCGTKAWYVGKAEGQSFFTEIFTHHKANIFNDVLASKKGIPQIYLIPRLSTGGKLCRPGKMRRQAIDFLETMLIGMALPRNPELKNIKDTKMLREIRLPAFVRGNAPGHPGKPAAALKRILRSG